MARFLRARLERMVADSLQPWLLRPPDVQLALRQGGTQLRLQLRELQLDVGKLNSVSMGSSPLLLHAAQVQELELNLALMGTPAVLTGILRGMHVVLCPRPAEDTWWEKSRASAAGEAEEAAAADDIPSSSSRDHSQGDGGNPPPVENLHKGRSSSTNSFLVQCLVSLALSAIRLELHDCSVTVLLHPYSNCSRSYSCSLALNSLVLEEGCIENNNTAGGGSGSSSTSQTGLFGATLTAVHSSWKQMGTCMTKQCIVQQLTVQLKTLNSSDLSAVGGAATSSRESKSFGTAHEQQQKQQGEEDLQGFGKDSSNLPLGKIDSLVPNRDRILLLEDVTIAIRMQDVEFQGVEGDILEAVIGLDARDIDILSVLVTQLQGTSIHVTNKAGAMASRSLNDDSIAAEDDHMVKQQSEKDREQNKDSLTIAPASQNQGLALNTNVTKSSTLSTSSSSNGQAMTQVSPSSVHISAQGLFGVLAWRIWMQSFVHVIIFARQRFLQVGLKSFEGIPRSMVKPWTWVLGLAQVSHIMKNTTAAEEIHSSNSTGTLASTTEAAAAEEEEPTSADKIEDDVLSRVAVARRWVPTYALRISSGSLTLACAAAAVSDDDGVPYDSTFSAGVNRKAAVQPAVHLTLDRLSLVYGSNERATGSSVVCGSLQLHLLSILQAQPTQELEQSFNHDIIYQGRWPTIAAHTVQLLQSHPCSERKYSHHSYSLLDMVAAEVSHATIAVEKHHRWQEHQSSAWSSRIWKRSAHVLGGGLVQVGTAAAAAAAATGSNTTLLNKMMAPLQTGSASPFLIAEYQQIADVVERGGHLCGLTSCAMSMGQLECFFDSGISYQLSPLLVQLLNVGVPSPPHPESRGATAAPSSFVQPETSSSLNVIWTKTIKHCRSLLATAIPESFLELSVMVNSPKFRLTAAATPPTDPGDGNFKASHHSSSTGSATLVVDLGSLQIMVWPALRATPLSQLEPPKDPSKSVDESVRWWKDTLDSSSSSSSSSVWLKRPPLPHLPQQFPWAEHEQVGSNLCIVVEDLATMLQVEGCNQTEVPLVGPISCRMESSFCRDVFCGPLGPIKSLSLAIDIKVAGVTIHMYLEELAALSEILNCYRIAFTDGFLSKARSMGGEGSISAFTDEDCSAPSEVCEDSANSEIVHRTGGGESSLHASTENMLLGLFALSVNAQLEAFQVAFGGHRKLEEKDSNSNSSREASKIAALVLSKDSSSTSKPEVGNGRNRDNTTREIATSGWNIQLPGPRKGPGAYLVTKVFSLDLLLGDGHDSHLFAELDGATVGVVNDGVLSPEPPKRELRSSHQLSSLDHSSTMASDSIQEFKLLMQLPGTTNCAIDRCVVKLCGPKLVGEGISAGAADEEVASRNQVQESKVQPIQYVDTNQLGSKKTNETRTAVVVPKSRLLSHVSSSTAVDLSQLLPDESGTPLLGRSKSLSNLAVEEHDNNESNPHTKPANVNKLSENNNTVFWVSATAEVGRVMVMAGRMEAIVAKVVLVASGGSTLRMNLGITKDLQSITFVTEGGMLFVQTLALSTLVEYFGIYTKLFAETATAVPNLPSKEQSRNALEHQFKPSSDGGDQDQLTPLSRITQRSVSLPPWAPTRRSKQMRRLSSAPRRLQGEAKQDGPPQAAAAGFEGLVSTRISGFSLVLVQTGASAAGPGEGFLLELDGNANLQVGGKVPKVAIAVTRFSILGLQARAVGDTRGNNTKSARIPQFGRILSAKGGDTSAAGVDELAGQLLAENTAFFGDDKTIPEAVAGLESSITNTKGKADGSGGPWRPIMQDLNSYILERLSISCTIERAPIIENRRTWKWRNAWHGQCSVSGLDFAITTSEVQLLLAIAAPLSGLSSSSSEAAVTDNTKRTQATEVESSEATSSPYHIPDGAVIAIKDLSEHSYLAVEENTPKSGQFHLVGVLHYTLAGDKALFKVKHQKNSSTGKTVWFSLLSLHARNSEGEPFRVHYRPGSGLADIATVNDKSWELWQCVPSESVVADEGTEELDIRRSRSVFHLVNQKSKSGLALLDGAPVLVKQPGHPFKVKILAQPYKAKENISSSSSSPDGSDVVGGGEELQHAQDVEGEAIVAATVPLVKCDIQNVTLTLLYEAAGGLHLLPLLQLHMYDMGAVLQVGSFKTRAMSGCNVSLDYFEAQSNCWVPVINPIGTDFVYRTRTVKNSFSASLSKKTPTSIFSQLKKVDVVISEPALDTCLFLIGALEFAGPYTLRQSPVLANRCLVGNHTGVELLCCFDHGNAKQDGSIGSWESGAFLIRHTKSRRDLTSAVVASSVNISLQKGGTTSSAVQVSLADPGVRATRTRLELGEGEKSSAPGPLVVVDVTRQSQGGLSLTVSSMVRIVNASGLSLELQCRRPNQEGEGAVVLLEDGDIIDDSMGSFDALHLQGELRKALTSFNVGNFLLSIRPASVSSSTGNAVEEDTRTDAALYYEWSDDVKGAKAIRVSGLFENLHYNFRKLSGRQMEFSFATVFCPLQNKEKKNESGGKFGSYFLIRSTRRQVPVFKPTSNKDRNQGRQSVTAWQEQQEVVLLPTIRFLNLLTCDICTKLFAMTPDEARGGPIEHVENEVIIKGGEKACVYADLANLSLIIVLNGYGLTSKPVTINEREKSSSQFSLKRKGNDLKEVEAEINFGDDIHYAMLRVYRGGDGVLEVVVYTKYALHNDSHVPLLFCAPKQKSSYLWRRGRSKDTAWEWTSSPETVATLDPGSKTSWLNRSSKIAMKRVEPEAEAALLDLESLSGSAEITFKVAQGQSLDQQVQLGVKLQLPSVGDTNPTHIVHLIPRYIVRNESAKAICVCQDGFQDDIRAVMVLNPGDKTAMHAQVQSDPLSTDPTTNSPSGPDAGQNPALPLLLSVRFRPQESGWGWSGPVCAASLGSFCVKIRGQGQGGYSKQSVETTASQKQAKEKLWFAVAEVQEASPSLIVVFQKQVADAIPYRIENGLRSGSILYQQKGLNQPEVLESGASVSYAWDDLALPHKLVVTIAGTQMCREINMDKLRAWKLFRTATHKKGFMLQLPFQDDPGEVEEDKDILTDTEFLNVGFEVCADGPTRVLRVCKDAESNKKSQWQSNIKRRQTEMDVRVPLLCLSIVEPGKQKGESLREDAEEIEQGPPERSLSYTPIIVARMTSLVIEGLVTVESTLCQFKVQQLDVDITWPGAPLARMLRVHGQDRFKKQGQTVLQMAAVVAHRGTNPIQIHYASLLLQTVDLNVDEDTLMRLAPFYRSSLAETTTPSRLIYYDRFEIHPIKIVASFIPGSPQADYTSAQETLRALLHSVIKIPAIHGTTVELNGVLLSNALLTYRQLAVKCAQHYSWYAMRAIYIARGSSLLPPAFASLFDDSASSSLDVFFDPSNGSIDMQGLTLGMFNILSKGLRKKGQGGTSRYLGDLEHTMRAAGSNLLFAVVTEVSDSVLKGAETSGFDGLVNGFRRGILNVAMKPAVLRSAVLQGGSTRIIKLDRNVGMDEVYIEGYLQAMLDALFKQDYLRVKVSDDQVLLKNLPPNTALMEEIMGAVKSFLIGEGLLVGESSMSGARAFRRGGNERRLGPALLALSEQLLVVIVVRGLRRQAIKVLHLPRNDQGKSQQEKMEETEKEKEKVAANEEQQEGTGLRVRHAVSNFVISSALAYLDGRLCRHIPNTLVRRIVSGFLLSFVE